MGASNIRTVYNLLVERVDKTIGKAKNKLYKIEEDELAAIGKRIKKRIEDAIIEILKDEFGEEIINKLDKGSMVNVWSWKSDVNVSVYLTKVFEHTKKYKAIRRARKKLDELGEKLFAKLDEWKFEAHVALLNKEKIAPPTIDFSEIDEILKSVEEVR